MNDFGYNLLINLISSSIAGLLGAFVAFWIERNRRPKLTFEIEKPPVSLGNRTHLRILVHNQRMRFFERNPALMCSALIEFYYPDPDRIPVYSNDDGTAKSMQGRWACTPEPVQPILLPNGQQAKALPNIPHNVDIPVDEKCALDVAMRFSGEDVCYGWNNDGYFHVNFKNDKWRLSRGKYIVKVKVKTGGREFNQEFLLINDIEFRLSYH